MPLRLDDNLLSELGLASLPADDKKAMLQQVRDTLEMRVGTRLAEQMTDQQLDEFEQFVQNQDDAGALQWLESNFPNYKDVVNEEFEKLQSEVKQAAPQILASGGDDNASAAGPASDTPADDASASDQPQQPPAA
jgi:predicted RNA-binding Zn ribbon-like protein